MSVETFEKVEEETDVEEVIEKVHGFCLACHGAKDASFWEFYMTVITRDNTLGVTICGEQELIFATQTPTCERCINIARTNDCCPKCGVQWSWV